MVEIEDKIDTNDLPTRIRLVFKQKVRIYGIMRDVTFFCGDNGKSYHMRAYSSFLGLGETGLHNRIVLFGHDHENMLLSKEEMNRVKSRSRIGNPTGEYQSLSDDEDAGNLALANMKTTEGENALFKSRGITDSGIGVSKTLRTNDGIKKDKKPSCTNSEAKRALERFNATAVKRGVIDGGTYDVLPDGTILPGGSEP